jgi:hypothetical protein
LPKPSASSQAITLLHGLATGRGSAVERPELTIAPSPVCAAVATSPPEITSTIGSPMAFANSQSRSSWPGTAMIAPVP